MGIKLFHSFGYAVRLCHWRFLSTAAQFRLRLPAAVDRPEKCADRSVDLRRNSGIQFSWWKSAAHLPDHVRSPISNAAQLERPPIYSHVSRIPLFIILRRAAVRRD